MADTAVRRKIRPRETITTSPAPQIIKYMGSKAKILPFVVDGLNEVYRGGGVCDLFAGSCILSGFIGRSVPVFSNDIQAYSNALAGFYLNSWRDRAWPTSETVIDQATKLAAKRVKSLPKDLSFEDVTTMTEFNRVEKRNRAMIDEDFNWKFSLFARCYSGTWWSAEQCVWIDALREVAESYRGTPYFDLMIVTLLHAMAYCGSGTGHYAQYRDAKTISSFKDISIYRKRSIAAYFAKKYDSLSLTLPEYPPKFKHEITALDYRERLSTLPRCTVYADPPYAFVHYSRFYHAMETLYLYDFPALQVKAGSVVKGRYREDRHQSPFCIRTQVPSAFRSLFEGVVESGSNLVLSYSKSGMISFDDLVELANESLPKYKVDVATSDHRHMTMGRRADRHRDVEEVLLLAQRRS